MNRREGSEVQGWPHHSLREVVYHQGLVTAQQLLGCLSTFFKVDTTKVDIMKCADVQPIFLAESTDALF